MPATGWYRRTGRPRSSPRHSLHAVSGATTSRPDFGPSVTTRSSCHHVTRSTPGRPALRHRSRIHGARRAGRPRSSPRHSSHAVSGATTSRPAFGPSVTPGRPAYGTGCASTAPTALAVTSWRRATKAAARPSHIYRRSLSESAFDGPAGRTSEGSSPRYSPADMRLGTGSGHAPLAF